MLIVRKLQVLQTKPADGTLTSTGELMRWFLTGPLLLIKLAFLMEAGQIGLYQDKMTLIRGLTYQMRSVQYQLTKIQYGVDGPISVTMYTDT